MRGEKHQNDPRVLVFKQEGGYSWNKTTFSFVSVFVGKEEKMMEKRKD